MYRQTILRDRALQTHVRGLTGCGRVAKPFIPLEPTPLILRVPALAAGEGSSLNAASPASTALHSTEPNILDLQVTPRAYLIALLQHNSLRCSP